VVYPRIGTLLMVLREMTGVETVLAVKELTVAVEA
jgi:hypothetical protein